MNIDKIKNDILKIHKSLEVFRDSLKNVREIGEELGSIVKDIYLKDKNFINFIKNLEEAGLGVANNKFNIVYFDHDLFYFIVKFEDDSVKYENKIISKIEICFLNNYKVLENIDNIQFLIRPSGERNLLCVIG